MTCQGKLVAIIFVFSLSVSVALLTGCQKKDPGIVARALPEPKTSAGVDPGRVDLSSAPNPVEKSELLRINSLALMPALDNRPVEARSEPINLGSVVETVASEEIQVELHPVSKLPNKNEGVRAELKYAIELARNKGWDGVMLTRVDNYIERRGSAFAADRSAEVSLTLSIYRASDGKELWSTSQHLLDQAASQDIIGSIRKGSLAWQTAPKLFERAFRQACREYNQARLKAFGLGN